MVVGITPCLYHPALAAQAHLVCRSLPLAWSPPSCTSPNNYGAGLLLGLDIYDAVCESAIDQQRNAHQCNSRLMTLLLASVVINTEEALQTFFSHKITLAGDISVVAGPVSLFDTCQSVPSSLDAKTYSTGGSRCNCRGWTRSRRAHLQLCQEPWIIRWRECDGSSILGKTRGECHHVQLAYSDWWGCGKSIVTIPVEQSDSVR